MNGGHFKLGLFVTVAITLLVAFLLTLGVLDRFKPRVAAETYFRESIQSLQTGAQVRYRGVAVGAVDWIGFASTRYPQATQAPPGSRYRGQILVELKLFSEVLTHAGLEDIRAELEAGVKRGLRARLASSGLGGPTFIEIDYLDPAAYPPPDLGWTPENIHIPSAPSTVVSIIDSLVSILRKVDELKVIDELALVGKDLLKVLETIETTDVLAKSGDAMAALGAASADARSLLADPRLDGIVDDAGATFKGARTLLEGDRDELETLVGDMTRMADTLDRAGSSLDALAANVNESNLISRMNTLADELGPAGRDLSGLAGRLDRLVKGNEQQIADAIRSLRDAALELQAMLEDLKANPSRLLGEPPPKGTPGGGS